MHETLFVVHTFNVDHAKQGTVEELPDKYARSLIRTGRARLATEDEIASGTAAPAEPADDQMPLGSAAVPTPDTKTDMVPADADSAPEPPAEAVTAPSGKVTAVPKPSAGKATATISTPTTSSTSAGDTAGK